MNINIERLKDNLLHIGMIGKDIDGGITRLGFSKEYYAAIQELEKLFREQNLEVEIDRVGNLIGRRNGKNKEKAIILGSHLDTVKKGGIFDGALGVMAALECIAVLNDKKIETDHPIEIVAFNAEEGNELGGTFGSRIMTGNQNLDDPELIKKLRIFDLTLDDLKSSQKDMKKVKAFLELHIEQGGHLYNNNLSIGIVNGIAGITRYRINIKGEANHAGTTPMNLRKDALSMAARLLLKIDEVSKKIGSPFVATVGQLTLKPGSVNVIPGEVELVLELRDMSKENIDLAMREIIKYSKDMTDYTFNFEQLIDKPKVDTNKEILGVIESVCSDLGIPYEHMVSGAGHDAKEMALKVPVGLIFVPSKDGKSHCKEEYTPWEDIEKGTQVLLATLLGIDKR